VKISIPESSVQSKVLEPSDALHLRAAEGWLELGDDSEAQAELKQISLAARFHPLVLLARWEIFARKQHWEFAHTVAQGLVRLVPDEPKGWINRSAALHAMKRTPEAWQSLLPAAEKFPQNPLIAYNLARYACQLGRFQEANRWLQRAVQMRGGKRLKWIALKDPDLEPLWGGLGSSKPHKSE
jgi:predicted Zn-dependent protease